MVNAILAFWGTKKGKKKLETEQKEKKEKRSFSVIPERFKKKPIDEKKKEETEEKKEFFFVTINHDAKINHQISSFKVKPIFECNEILKNERYHFIREEIKENLHSSLTLSLAKISKNFFTEKEVHLVNFKERIGFAEALNYFKKNNLIPLPLPYLVGLGNIFTEEEIKHECIISLDVENAIPNHSVDKRSLPLVYSLWPQKNDKRFCFYSFTDGVSNHIWLAGLKKT